MSLPRLSAEALVAIVIALLSLFVSGFSSYTVNDAAIGNRLTAVETQQKNDRDWRERMENKVDHIRDLLEHR